MKRILAILALLCSVATSQAVDTWEPYPLGPGAIEFYLTRSGFGLGDPAAAASSIVLGPSWGLHETTHLNLYTGIRHPDEGEGGLDFLSLGIYRNFVGGLDGRFKLDAYFELAAFGPALGMSSATAILEFNLDFQRTGLYARPAMSFLHDELGEGDSALSAAVGAWRRLGERMQLLAEATVTERNDALELDSLAGGLNVLVTKEVELILELRGLEPPAGGERSFDATVGAVTVW